MSWYKWLTAAILLCCASLLGADDPFSGTWKIDPPKSSFSNGKFPKNMSITIQATIQGEVARKFVGN